MVQFVPLRAAFEQVQPGQAIAGPVVNVPYVLLGEENGTGSPVPFSSPF